MKILVCMDGSKHGQRVLDEAAKIAGGCNADEVVVIYVYNQPPDYSVIREKSYTAGLKAGDMELFRELEEKRREEKKKLLADAVTFFETKNIKASSMFEEGHPADIINKVADKGKFDLVVIGNRGMGGLKRLFLGSVSNAVVQQAKTSVLTVK